MGTVTDTKQEYDPWMDPDPQPERVEAWFDDPENVWYSIDVPPHMTTVIRVPSGMGDEEWGRRKEMARARGERLPEETAAEEKMLEARAEEEKDWSPEQKAARQAERMAAEEAFAMRDRGEIPTGSAVTWHRGGDLREWPTREALEQNQD